MNVNSSGIGIGEPRKPWSRFHPIYTMTDKTCGNCRAFDSGICKRRSPLTDTNRWPAVKADEWCAEHIGIKDESGWMDRWPEREKLLALVDGRRTKKAIIEAIGWAGDVAEVSYALTRLVKEGAVTNERGIYTPVPARPDPVNPSVSRWTDGQVIRLFPVGEHVRMPLVQIQKMAEVELHMPLREFSIFRFNLLTDGSIKMHKDGMYYRQ